MWKLGSTIVSTSNFTHFSYSGHAITVVRLQKMSRVSIQLNRTMTGLLLWESSQNVPSPQTTDYYISVISLLTVGKGFFTVWITSSVETALVGENLLVWCGYTALSFFWQAVDNYTDICILLLQPNVPQMLPVELLATNVVANIQWRPKVLSYVTHTIYTRRMIQLCRVESR